jgi:hypothetical protein
MPLEYIPVLQKQLELYTIPVGTARFDVYIKLVLGEAIGSEDIVLPPFITVNPMAKAHALEHVEALLALGAEEIAREAMQEAQSQLDIKETFKVSTVLLDDLKGGWTNRYLNEAFDYFQAADRVKKFGWITVPCWTTDKPSALLIKQNVLAYIYRTMYVLKHGKAHILGDVLEQEGLALKFAGITQWLDSDDLDYSLLVITPHLSTEHYPTQFACLFGDEAAKAVGYSALGLSARAGCAVALEGALSTSINPLTHLEPVGP